MSLGFLTESALLPSKSKKIEVDGRSQLRKSGCLLGSVGIVIEWRTSRADDRPASTPRRSVPPVSHLLYARTTYAHTYAPALKAIVAEELSKREAAGESSEGAYYVLCFMDVYVCPFDVPTVRMPSLVWSPRYL